MGISTSSSTYVPKLNGSQGTLIETVTSPDQIYIGNGTSPTPYLPRQAIKTIEAIGPNFEDISIGCQTCSHKQRASVPLMTHIIDTCDLESYTNVQGKLEWEQAM